MNKHKKKISVTGNLNVDKTSIIITVLRPNIKMRRNSTYSFKSQIYQSIEKIVSDSKKLSFPAGIFTNLEEKLGYSKNCEQNSLDLGNVDVR